MYGKAYQKNTRFRLWGKSLAKFGFRRAQKKGTISCGRDKHAHLGWGGEDTAKAALYPKQLCKAYADAIMNEGDRDGVAQHKTCSSTGTGGEVDTHTAEDTVTVIAHGRVHRHTSRGLDTEGSKEVKENMINVVRQGFATHICSNIRWCSTK